MHPYGSGCVREQNRLSLASQSWLGLLFWRLPQKINPGQSTLPGSMQLPQLGSCDPGDMGVGGTGNAAWIRPLPQYLDASHRLVCDGHHAALGRRTAANLMTKDEARRSA
jgi:hypothetical protein